MIFRTNRVRSAVIVGLIAVALVSVLAPLPASATPAPTSRPAGVSITSTVTWNGVNVDTASGVSSALSINLAQQANLRYNWSVVLLAEGPITVTDARLQMFYFGYAVASRDVTVSNPTPSLGGTIVLNWTPISVSYVLSGVYRLTASLLVANGSTAWSENFFVRGTAAYGILAALPIILVLIAVYELYLLARSGRFAALGRAAPAPTPPPASPPPPPPDSPAAPPPDAPPPGGNA